MIKLNESENIISITSWLIENLKDDKSIIPHLNKIPNINSKGIYFWFMKTDGYKELSKFISINPIEPRYTRTIDDVQYDLVYLGTAGTGKKGNSNLAERFEWHINQAHTISNVCHGTLSTLRAGLGSLLADDLIIPDTENLVNSFMKNYMKVFWIEYTDDKLLIDNDEKILIKVLRPLLNIKNNPNAKANAPANSTKSYKIRRAVVYKNTRLRIGCKGESEKIKEKNNPNKDTPIYNHQIVIDNNEDCLEYFVLQNQHIGEITRGIEGLPLGKCKITIYDSNNPKIEFTEWKRVTGNNNDYNAQNIYKYFDNTSSSGLRRFIVIQNWMKENDIEEITVKVCSVGDDNLDKIKNNASPEKSLVEKDDKSNSKMKTLIIIPCCKRKLMGGIQINQPQTFFENDNILPELILKRNNRIQNISVVDQFDFLPAWERYDGHLYRKLKEHQILIDSLIQHGYLDIIIISALYGVINYNTPINNYDLRINELNGINYWKNQNTLSNAINLYCEEKNYKNIYTYLTPNSYYKAALGLNENLIEHEQVWPIGLRGINNIYNNLSNLIIFKLNQISNNMTL